MNKIISKAISACLVISCLLTMTPYAATEKNGNLHVPPTNTKLSADGQTYSEDAMQVLQRGPILIASVSNISDAGGGEIGILVDTMCHVSVGTIYVTIYLGCYNEETDEWSNERVYQFEFTPEDTPDGKLHAMLISFHETEQESGCYYRLWAYHEVGKNDVWKTMRMATDGVLIISIP